MSNLEKTESFRGRKAYFQLTFLGLLLHISQTIVFGLLNCPLITYYNIFSIFFYGFMLLLIRKKLYRSAVSSIHVEVCIFAVVCTLCGGWRLGTPLYLLALSSLVYFCPFRHKSIAYLFSACEMFLFLILRLFAYDTTPLYTHIPNHINTLLYIYSAVCSFGIILFGAFTSKVSSFTDYQQLQKENETLQSLASHDFLTGLLSRRAFLEQISTRPAHSRMFIAMGDVDDFKLINDSYGHGAGDHVLRRISQLLRDRSGNGITACRWGGEEFILLLEAMPEKDALETVRALCREIAKQKYDFSGKQVSVTMTFGMCTGFPEDDILEIIGRADSLLYKGKHQGKNQVVFG